MINNFLIARLCDNDYGTTLKHAILDGIIVYGMNNEKPIEVWERFIKMYVMSNQILRDVAAGKTEDSPNNHEAVANHLDKRLKVTYERHKPTDDHDGGSAAYDFTTEYAFAF